MAVDDDEVEVVEAVVVMREGDDNNDVDEGMVVSVEGPVGGCWYQEDVARELELVIK